MSCQNLIKIKIKPIRPPKILKQNVALSYVTNVKALTGRGPKSTRGSQRAWDRRSGGKAEWPEEGKGVKRGQG